MVHAFMHQQEKTAPASSSHIVGGSFLHNGSMGTGPNEDYLDVGAWQEQTHILKVVLRNCEEAELGVLAHVTTFIETNGRQQARSALQRSVMAHLRSRGYDAAICKSQPSHHKKHFPGKYEFMDVIINTHNNTRLVVDIDFRVQFEIAMPTKEYVALLQLLPAVYLGNSDKLLQIVKIMTDSVKISLKAKGMHIPPWRTYTYMVSKWLGSYRRTTNCSSASSTDDEKGVGEGTAFRSYEWKPCHGGEEKKLMSRLASALMEATIRSMSGTEQSRLCGDKLHPELAVA